MNHSKWIFVLNLVRSYTTLPALYKVPGCFPLRLKLVSIGILGGGEFPLCSPNFPSLLPKLLLNCQLSVNDPIHRYLNLSVLMLLSQAGLLANYLFNQMWGISNKSLPPKDYSCLLFQLPTTPSFFIWYLNFWRVIKGGGTMWKHRRGQKLHHGRRHLLMTERQCFFSLCPIRTGKHLGGRKFLKPVNIPLYLPIRKTKHLQTITIPP